MRISKNEDTYILSKFATSDTVTITVYDLFDDSVLVNASSMSEIGTTGVFKYLFNPVVSAKKEYLAISDNGTSQNIEKLVFSGYVDDLALEATSSLIQTETDKIQNLNNFDPANDVVANVTLVDAVTANTDTPDIHSLLDSYSNKDDYKASVSEIQLKTTQIKDQTENIDTKTSEINDTVNPIVIDPKENYNAIKDELEITPKTHGQTFNVRVNQTLKDKLIVQGEIIPNANYFKIDSHEVRMVVDNGLTGDNFILETI